jgi:CxxC motif-containing protein
MNSETADIDMVCIVCPVGCRLRIRFDGETPLVSGNRCPRGEEYALEELLAPRRVVTATCGIRSREHLRLPVKTDAPLPFELIESLLKEVYALSVKTPVKRGDVLISDFAGTGVQLVASRSIG